MWQVVPLQRRMHELMSRATDSAAPDWALYHRLSRRWELWGGVALLTPVAALNSMVLKPT